MRKHAKRARIYTDSSQAFDFGNLLAELTVIQLADTVTNDTQGRATPTNQSPNITACPPAPERPSRTKRPRAEDFDSEEDSSNAPPSWGPLPGGTHHRDWDNDHEGPGSGAGISA